MAAAMNAAMAAMVRKGADESLMSKQQPHTSDEDAGLRQAQPARRTGSRDSR
jgi:hypothetical protein